MADIEIEVPLRTERASTIRVVAASLGADAGFSVDEIDDFRLAISEVFSVLVDASPGGRARVAFTLRGQEVRATIGEIDAETPIELDDLALGILRSVLDEFTIIDNSAHLMKRAFETATTG